MVILHIAHVSEYMFFGVNVSVPQHVAAQQEYETVGFINTAGVRLDGIKNQFDFNEPFSFEHLPAPFSKPDLVVFHEVYQRKLLPIFNLVIKKKLPYVIIPHGCLTNQAQHKKHPKKVLGNALVYNRIIKNALAIQCLSEREVNETEFGGYKFIGTNGVNIEKTDKTFGGEGMTFVYIGRLDIEIKGLDLLIGALRENNSFLRENGCHFYAYGPNEMDCFERIRKLIIQSGTEDLITLNGPILGEKKREKLLAADCFIQCSRTEGMSMGILEALGTGLPCVLTKGTGIADIVEDCRAGWKCENTISSVSEGIRAAVENKSKLREYSVNAIKLAKENYSWSKVSLDALNEYKKLLKK